MPVRRCAASVHPPLSLDNVTHETCARLRCQTARGKSAWVYSMRERGKIERKPSSTERLCLPVKLTTAALTLSTWKQTETKNMPDLLQNRGGGGAVAAERPDRNVSLF